MSYQLEHLQTSVLSHITKYGRRMPHPIQRKIGMNIGMIGDIPNKQCLDFLIIMGKEFNSFGEMVFTQEELDSYNNFQLILMGETNDQ